MKTFNEIYIIDLHGNAKKKETTRDGGKDENVFDIQQGVAIALFVKMKKSKGCKVYHRDIYGPREEKYGWLGKKQFRKKDYEMLEPETPWYFLVKRNTEGIEHYNNWIRVDEIFPVNSVGIVTARDELTIKWTASEILNTIRTFAKMDEELARQTYNLGKDVRDWKISLAQKDLIDTRLSPENVVPILYRPFDSRFTYYTGVSRGFHCMPRGDVMRQMLKGNIGLAIGRQGQAVGNEFAWNLSFITQDIIDFNLFYRGGELLFPLYLYPPSEEKKKKGIQAMMLFEPEEPYGKKGKLPNIAPKVIAQLEKAYNKKFIPSPSGRAGEGLTPEQILYYCYAVLYSNIYREKYAEFLKIDFPRIPFTADKDLFAEMAALGEELASLHLLKHKSLSHPTTKYFGKGGSDVIEKPVYDEETERVCINEARYFDNITKEVWEYQVGGYQPMEKYLKDRKGRQMDDPAHYCKMATAILKTIELQKKADILFAKAEKKVIEIKQ
jgi:predicted helicase